MVISRLPLFGDHGAIGVVLNKEEERTLRLLNAALRVLNKSIYTAWIRYFGEGEGRRKGVKVEALLLTGSRGLSFLVAKRTLQTLMSF